MEDEKHPAAIKVPRKFSARIRQERTLRGWSQGRLAEAVGTTQRTVSLWERDESFPTPYFRERLADVFKKNLVELGLVEDERESDSSQAREIADGVPPSAQGIWNVPYRRNPYFTGREDILAWLATVFDTGKTMALTQAQAISGLGGIGKTQIAIEYTYRYHDNYSAVLWVSASTRDKLIEECAVIARFLPLGKQDNEDEDSLAAAVKHWLATHSNWLLVLDNLDDLSLIDEIVPRRHQGAVLLTTRVRALGMIARGIEVDKMGVDEGALFLLRRAKLLGEEELLEQATTETRALADRIVSSLDGLPLALDQAGAYIEETRCGLQHYLTLYETHRKELLQWRGPQAADHPEPVAATWALSFQKVERENPASAELLRLCAFLYADTIPESLIIEGAEELGPEPGSIAMQPLAFDMAIGTLLRYSLLRRDPEERVLSIHRLVQTVIQDRMADALRITWAERVVRMLSRVFPQVEPAAWDKCQLCLPHAQLAVDYIKTYGFRFLAAARLLHQVAVYLIDHARYKEVEPLLQDALIIRRQQMEEDHPDIIAILHDSGRLYYFLGQYRQAETLLQQALAARRRTLGEDHPDTLKTRVALAQVYSAKGEYDEAKRRYIAILTTLEQQSGKDHTEVAKTMNDLATVYRAKGEYAEAERLFQEALSLRQRLLGPNHPDVAQTMNNLARLYRAQGKYNEAVPYYEEALAIREQMYGPNSVYVAESLSSLAKLDYSLGKLEEAKLLCQRALSILEEGLFSNHPTVANTLITLAKISQTEGKYEEAIQYYQQALPIREKSLGVHHPHVAVILNSLGEIYQAQGLYHDALPLIERSFLIRQNTLGDTHPYLAYSLSELAENYATRGDTTRAEELYAQAIAIRERTLGVYHPNTLATYEKLAKLYQEQGRASEARALYQKAGIT